LGGSSVNLVSRFKQLRRAPSENILRYPTISPSPVGDYCRSSGTYVFVINGFVVHGIVCGSVEEDS
jgi:hypothetical protein